MTALAASTLACQAVIGVHDYDFEPAGVEARTLSNASDAGSDAGASIAAGAGYDASAAGLDADAAVTLPDDSTLPPCRGPDCTSSTCDGCVVGARCVPRGQALPSNPCLVCDPAQSASGYSIAFGKTCGAEPSACSARDSCDADGFCAPNDLPEGTACADATGAACDAADTCDGAGGCVDRRADDGTACEDGQFCTTGDQCHAGLCASGGALECGANEQCVEDADACECAGCRVDGACVAAGARAGACFVCDPQRSRSAFSPDEGAVCGDPEGECFGARTCNSNGDCLSRPLDAGAACGSPFGTDCSGPDSCNGSGSCSSNDALDGTSCEDGLICTDGDSCRSGRCGSGGELFCGGGLTCVEGEGCVCPDGLIDCPEGCRRFCGNFPDEPIP